MHTYFKKDSEHEASFGWRKCCSSILWFENAAEQLHKGFFLLRWHIRGFHKLANVRRGHFSVVTAGNGKSKKFFVDLRYLRHPQFLRLLDAAEEEFGLNQKGVLVVPCEASELQRILSTKHID